MDNVKIQILIPTYNNIDEIDETMESIYNSNYNMDDVYVVIVDFGSTDGTYEKIIKFNKKNIGIYQKGKNKNFRLRVAIASRILQYVHAGGTYCFKILLYPGDVLYNDCIKKCSEVFVNYSKLNPVTVVCETDIKFNNGEIKHQKPLFSSERVISGNKQVLEYVNRGYSHQIFQMVHNFHQGYYKANGEINEQRYWNKLIRSCDRGVAIYIPEALVCTKEVSYPDEFQEILFRWEAIISQVRFYNSVDNENYNSDFESMAKNNLANYALWRSYWLYKKEGNKKVVEDCFLISEIIDAKIVESELYNLTKNLLYENNSDAFDKLKKLYD